MIGLLLGNWRFLGAGLAVGLVLGGWAVWWERDQMAARGQLQQAVRTIHEIQYRDRVTARVETRYLTRTAAAREITRTITQRIPEYVTVETDRAYGSLPLGLVRTYNASGLSALPAPPDQSDSAPSGVSPSAFAAIAAGNNGACNEIRERAIAWQAWADEQARAH